MAERFLGNEAEGREAMCQRETERRGSRWGVEVRLVVVWEC